MKEKLYFMLLTLVVTVALTASVAAKTKERVLYRFTGGIDGADPSSILLMDAAGNLYGTTLFGGNLSQCNNGGGCGVVFELSPAGNGSWRESVLYAFSGGSDGAWPTGNLVLDASGNLYGTTSGGGKGGKNCTPNGCGAVFELSPNPDGNWTKTILYNFQGNPDGEGPSGLTLDASGVLYGTAANGVAYALSPPPEQGNPWTEKILSDAFVGTPNPILVFDDQGDLYGTYYSIDIQWCGYNCGAVFELKPAKGQWAETDLYDFLGGGNGGQPPATVVLDAKGNLYGTAAEGGNNWGIVWRLSRSGAQWKEKMLYNFCSRNNCVDGAFPWAGLVMDSKGALYGTTYSGGAGCGCGTVFKLVHTLSGWKETVLHSFRGDPFDGLAPQEGLILDAHGNLYGVANSGANQVAGVVFEVTP